MTKTKILIVVFCLFKVFCNAQEQFFSLSPLELSIKICNSLKKNKLITTNFCINEDNVGFNFEIKSDSKNEKNYNVYFSDFVKSSISEHQYKLILKKYSFNYKRHDKATYSNKKLWIIYKPIIIEREYFVLILKQEKGTGDMFVVHLRINDSNKFYVVNQSGVWQ